MSATGRGSAFRDLGRLFRRGALPSGDGALLECFVSEGDQSAFEAIIARHGSMVLGVCRRVLRDPHDADDAFQATFLVLVKKARQLRDADRLGPWLYGVANRVATKARAREARRRGSLRVMPDDLAYPHDADGDWLDVRPILDAELSKLSPKLRDILVLCLLEGLTAEEVAGRGVARPCGDGLWRAGWRRRLRWRSLPARRLGRSRHPCL
jgi:RNA polymerase sigma factor (sigma-70 family)